MKLVFGQSNQITPGTNEIRSLTDLHESFFTFEEFEELNCNFDTPAFNRTNLNFGSLFVKSIKLLLR